MKNDLWNELSTGASLVTFKVILIYLNTCATLFSNFPPIFKNTAVSRDDIGNLMKLNPEKENIIVQPRRMPHIVDARREADENANSSVVAETMKVLAHSSYGYQIMDRSQHTVTKYLTAKKTHSAINSKMLEWLNHITDQMYEVELVKSEIEHRE